MDMKKQLLDALNKHVTAEESQVLYFEDNNGIDGQALFSYFVFKGDLIEKDETTGTYIGRIKTKGFFAKKSAYVAATIKDGILYMIVYANNGPTNLEISQEVADRILHM